MNDCLPLSWPRSYSHSHSHSIFLLLQSQPSCSIRIPSSVSINLIHSIHWNMSISFDSRFWFYLSLILSPDGCFNLPSSFSLFPQSTSNDISTLQSKSIAGPLTQLVKRSLSVSNPNNQPVAFKVKTTAPKQYCVRPNSGRIEPGEKVEVQGEYSTREE